MSADAAQPPLLSPCSSVPADIDDDGDTQDRDHNFLADLDEGEALTTTASVIVSVALNGTKRVRRHGSWYPDGPVDLPGVLKIPMDRLDDLLTQANLMGMKRMQVEMQKVAELNIVLTSCYSGTGAFESSAHMLFDRLRHHFPDSRGRIVSHSATEILPYAQRGLCVHTSGVKHVFGDILGRLPRSEREWLLHLQKSRITDYKHAKREHRLGQLSKEQLVETKNRLGNILVAEITDVLKWVEFNDTDYCLKCKKQCPVTPRKDPEHSTDYWIECSGNTCCPWSSMSDNDGWLDYSTLPFFVWSYSTRFFEPDTIMQENVPQFDHSELHRILSDMTPGVLKSLHTRKPSGLEDVVARGYEMQVQTFSPTDLGCPSSRCRKYTAHHLVPFVTDQFTTGFDALFFRRLCTDGSIYLKEIPDDILHGEMLRMAAEHKPGVVLQNAPGSLEAALTNLQYEHMEGALVCAKKMNICNDEGEEWTKPMALFSLTQRPEFWKRLNTDLFPALLRKSLFYNYPGKALVPVAAHWLVQGFPHPALPTVPSELKEHFPYPLDLVDFKDSSKCLQIKEQRELTGNAMHWAAIGCWLLHNLACTSKVFE